MRILATLAVLAMTVAASPAQAQGRGMTAAGLIGFEDGDGPAGIALRFDGEFPIQQIGPAVALSFVGSLGFTHSSEERLYGYGYDYRWDWSLNIFKAVPAARFTFGRSQTLRPYVDAGLGLYYASFTAPALESYVWYDAWGYPYYDTRVVDKTDSGIGFLMRLAAGLTFQVTPGFSLGGELDITPYFGDVDDTTLGLMFVAAFRM